VVIDTGLQEGDRIALRDPTRPTGPREDSTQNTPP
jgi:hypothetical protein